MWYSGVILQQEGGEDVESAILNFLMSVLANVVSYYICKKLDR